MNRFTKLLFALCVLPVVAFSQANNVNWTNHGAFPDTSQYTKLTSVHGLEVDASGKVFIMPYYPSYGIDVTFEDTNGGDSVVTKTAVAIYVFNADGTPNDTIAYAPSIGDTLGGAMTAHNKWEYMSGRGMRINKVNGFLYAIFFNRIYKINTTTHEVVARYITDGNSKAAPAFDGEGNVYLSAVAAGNAPIEKYDADLNFVENVSTGAPGGFSRSFEVSEDGTVYWSGYTVPYVLKWSKPDAFSPYQEVPDTVLRGFKAESFTFHPTTGRLWVSAGSPNDLPGINEETGYAYNMNTWYAFNLADIGTSAEIPVDSLGWAAAEGETVAGRARALAWTADGKTAYISLFSYTPNSVQKLTGTPVGTANEKITSIPDGYVLKNNYPNPFNPTTNIAFTLANSGLVKLNVFDMLGRQVATVVNRNLNSGEHTVSFDASNLSSGTYLYVLEVNGVRLTNKMTLIK